MKPSHQSAPRDSDVNLTMELCHPFETSRVLNDYETLSDSLMDRTNTLIYCPNEKSHNARVHNVYVSGQINDVESARLLIRDNVPIEFAIACGIDRVDSLGKDLLFSHFSSTFGVRLTFKLVTEDASYQVNIRGYRYRFDQIREALLHFCHITEIPSGSVEMEVSASKLHVSLVKKCQNMIEEKSGARICCPEDSNCVLIRGSLEKAYFASEMLTGLTPMFLKFKLPSCKKVERIRGIARRMDIAISVCKTAAECNELVLFSYEWNARHLHELRRVSLGLQSTVAVFPKETQLIGFVNLPETIMLIEKYESVSTFISQCNEDHILESHREFRSSTPNLRNI